MKKEHRSTIKLEDTRNRELSSALLNFKDTWLLKILKWLFEAGQQPHPDFPLHCLCPMASLHPAPT